MTSKQYEALKFIGVYTAEHGYAPSFQEIADGISLKSKAGVHRLVTSLVEQGKLVIRPGRARSVAVVGGPDPVSMAKALANELLVAHGLDDGDGMMIVCTPAECLKTLLGVLV